MNKKNNELDILNEGRRRVAVVFKDGSKGELTVKKVGLVDMSKLHGASDEIAQALCYIEDMSKDEVAKISDESLLDVLEAGQEINDPLFLRWLRHLERKLKIRGLDVEQLRAAVAENVLEELKSRSGESSPSSPETVTIPNK